MKSTTTNKKPDAVGSAEYKVIADRIGFPEPSLKVASHYYLMADDFANPECRDLWVALDFANQPTNDVESYNIVRNALHWDAEDEKCWKGRAEKMDWLLAQAGTGTIPDIADAIHKVTLDAYIRRVHAEVTTALATRPMDAIDYALTLRDAIDRVFRPPSLVPELPYVSEADIYGEEPKDELLHAEGLIDDIVDYSLRTAYYPNRTLAFSGALALMAHLMGRRYTDDGGTLRSNLYILALGRTGIGKNHARRVNGTFLGIFPDFNRTLAEDFVSGAALEDTVMESPATIFQIDEIQQFFGELADKRDKNARSMASKLMNLYTASGDPQYRLRNKSTSSNGKSHIGLNVNDPSVTIYGTGTDAGFCETINEQQIKTGLIGRFLIFRAVHKAKNIQFCTADERKDLPKSVTEFIEWLDMDNRRVGRDGTPEPIIVKYDEGAKETLQKHSDACSQKGELAESSSDPVGAALWQRAGGKLNKLALIFAVSRDRHLPKIQLKDVEKAWELVRFLTDESIRMIHDQMTSSDLESAYEFVLKYIKRETLARQKQKNLAPITRTDVSNNCKRCSGYAQNRNMIDSLLNERGEVAVRTEGKTTYYVCRDKYSHPKPLQEQDKRED